MIPAVKNCIGYAVLSILGFLQMTGWLLQLQPLEGLGFITNASPLPLVFSHFRGIEPFSSRFDIEITYQSGEFQTLRVTPEVYAQLEGPYNYRNVFGAVFAGGPRFTGAKETGLWTSVMHYGFCGPGALAKDFGIKKPVGSITVIQTSQARGIPGIWSQTLKCEHG